MKNYIILTILITTTFLNCNSQVKQSNCEELIEKQQDDFWKQLADFQNNYLPDENQQNYSRKYDFENNKLTVYKDGNLYLNIDFIYIGYINVSQNTWTWSWFNSEVNATNNLQDVIEFGKVNNCEKLTKATWSCEEKGAWQMLALSNYILNGKGGARYYTKSEYKYLLFTKIQKTN